MNFGALYHKQKKEQRKITKKITEEYNISVIVL